jgi:hypothetical protein
MGVDYGQGPQLFPDGELVVHEIRRRDLVRPYCFLTIIAKLRLDPALGMPVP